MFPPFTLLSCTNGGEEADIFPISARTLGLKLGLKPGLKLAPAVCVPPSFRSVFQLDCSVFSADALELEDGRTGATKAFLHKPNEQRFIPV